MLAVTFSSETILLDVRSPVEYRKGHVPGAHNLPLFSDQERAEVGTLYKQTSQETALLRGLEIAGPKMRQLVETALAYCPSRRACVMCWRGGMRSASVTWLLTTAGFEAQAASGGYKAYRRWAHAQCAIPRTLRVLGGATGSGKTEILYALAARGEQVLDLEALADHRGSSYGALGLPEQPTQEQFENRVGQALSVLEDRPVWLEHESRMIGICKIPDALFMQMNTAPLTVVTVPNADRIDRLRRAYGAHPKESLIRATERIRTRLGGERTSAAIHCIELGDLEAALKHILIYYDKAYALALERRAGTVYSLPEASLTPDQWAVTLTENA